MRFGWGYLIVVLLLVALQHEADSKVIRNRQRTRRLNKLNNNNSVRANTKVDNSRTTSTKASKNVQTKIVGGTVTDISEMPFQVQVKRGSSMCGGSLIDSEWVLTAAHCVKGIAVSQFTIIAGTSTLNGSDGLRRTVKKSFVAPKYKASTINMDAAMLKLNAPLNSTNIEIISLATKRPKAGSKLRIGGWGVTREGGSVSKQFRTAPIHVVKQQKCKQKYIGTASITKYMICATSKNKDSCSGDSGGGVTHNGKLVGVVSFGAGCANTGYPGVYTNVAMIRAWINKVMANN